MRWFKHMTGSLRDPKMAQLVSRHGMAGYGAYWAVLETVAEQVDERGNTSVCYPARHWARILGTYHAKQALIFLQSLADLSLISLDIGADLVHVDMPNILKYRDEWTRKKSRAPEKLRCKDSDLESEPDHKKGTPHEPPAGGGPAACSPGQTPLFPGEARAKRPPKLPPKEFPPDFEELWAEAHPLMRECGKKAAHDSWFVLAAAGALPGQKILLAALRRDKAKWSSQADPHVKHLNGWFADGRWDAGEEIVEAEKKQQHERRCAAASAADRLEQARQAANKAWAEAWLELSEDDREKWREIARGRNPVLAQAKDNGQTKILDTIARALWREHREEQIHARRRAQAGTAEKGGGHVAV